MIGQVIRMQYMKNRPNRSYGFIHGVDGEMYWFSLRDINDDIKVGDEVSFEGEENGKGFVASEVRLIHA